VSAIEFTADRGQLAPFKFGHALATPAFGRADQRSVHQFEYGAFAEGERISQSSARRMMAQSAVHCTLRLADFVRKGPADVYRMRRTCCIWVTTSMGVSAMFEDLPWEGTCVTLHESLGGKHELSSRAT
jgi:hypothetical protein